MAFLSAMPLPLPRCFMLSLTASKICHGAFRRPDHNRTFAQGVVRGARLVGWRSKDMLGDQGYRIIYAAHIYIIGVESGQGVSNGLR